jgi:FemAB-related protein (PEP-CTERM system-associated)
MTLTIKIADLSDKERWDRYVLEHPNSIAYQLFAWKDAVEAAYGFKGYYLIAEKFNKISGILPLINVHPPMMQGNLVSLPYCDAGGLLADSPEIEKCLILKARDLSLALNISKLTIRSVCEFAEINPKLTINKGKVRMILKLPRTSDLLLSSLKAKVRSQVNKPFRDGLIAQIGGKELIDEFYTIFSENMRDLGSPVHSKKWLKNIFKFYKNRAHAVLVKMPDNTPAAGGIILCNLNTVSVPWASSLRRFNRWNPNMCLYWTFLKFAADNGYKLFDFGRSTPDEGTFRFKKQWGAVPEHLHWADFKVKGISKFDLAQSSETIVSGKGKSRMVAERVLKSSSLSLSKGIGMMARKYITL